MSTASAERMSRSEADRWPRNISIIGAAGLVGSTVASQLYLAGIGSHLYLQDRKENVLTSHLIDLSDAGVLRNIDTPQLHITSPPGEEIDLVIVAASAPETPDGDRREFLQGNAKILASLVPQIRHQLNDQGIVLLLSNPVDVLADWLCSEFDFDRSRVLGYALNDSARFRQAIATELQVPTSTVHGEVYGEHGKGQVPIMSDVHVAGEHTILTTAQQARISAEVHEWFSRWSQLNSGRSSGWATGVGTALLVEQLATGQQTVATASTSTVAGLGETFMALPVKRVDNTIQVTQPSVTAPEFHQLQTSAESIRAAARAISIAT